MYMHLYGRKTVLLPLVTRPWCLARRQLARCKVCGRLERLSLCTPQTFLEVLLRGFPLGFQLSHLPLALRRQSPAPFAAVVANRVHRQATLFNERQSPGRGGLVDTDQLSELRCRELGHPLEHLQRRELRRVQPT